MSITSEPVELSIADAAARLGVSPKTIRRAIARGDLDARRIGARLIRIRVADLDAYGQPLGAGAR
ncbi:helix-turn-helix domain-containing protein [Microbacterium sp. GXF7504]